MKIPVIHQKFFPPSLPFTTTAVIFLLIERFDIGGFWRGVIACFVVAYWLMIIIILFNIKRCTPIFKENQLNQEEKKC